MSYELSQLLLRNLKQCKTTKAYTIHAISNLVVVKVYVNMAPRRFADILTKNRV